jgi:hypothetical protein
VHAGATAIGDALAARIQASAAKVAAAEARFVAQEASSSETLAAVETTR